MSEKLNCNGLKPCPFCRGEQILPELWEGAMTKERLMQLEDLLIWMSGGVVFSSDQADLFSEGLAFISAETVRQEPMKPVYDHVDGKCCPTCLEGATFQTWKHGYPVIIKMNYCQNCGQKLDWSEE